MTTATPAPHFWPGPQKSVDTTTRMPLFLLSLFGLLLLRYAQRRRFKPAPSTGKR